jgi:hypothetical protein
MSELRAKLVEVALLVAAAVALALGGCAGPAAEVGLVPRAPSEATWNSS